MSKTMFARPALEEAEARDVRAPAEISARIEENASSEEAGCVLCAGLTGTSISGLFDTRFGIDGTFEVRRCVRCGMEQLSPIPAPAELKNLYEHYYNFCGERGTVYTRALDDLAPAVPYDVAVLSNVLEHSLNPKAMLRSARRLLKADGEVWISCPNRQSWLRPVFGRWWIHWHVPFHITHYSADTLRNLLEESEFRHIEIRQITPALWAASSIVA